MKFPNLKTQEDFALWLKLLKKGYKILIVRELVGEHRVNYNLWKVIKRNFAIYIDTTKTYLRNKTYVEKFLYTSICFNVWTCRRK